MEGVSNVSHCLNLLESFPKISRLYQKLAQAHRLLKDKGTPTLAQGLDVLSLSHLYSIKTKISLLRHYVVMVIMRFSVLGF